MKNRKLISIRSIMILVVLFALLTSACSVIDTVSEKLNINNEQTTVESDDLIEDSEKGVVVTSVLEDGPAGEAGLMKGDVILKVADEEVNSVNELREAIAEYEPDDQVQFVIRRGTEKVVKTITLGEYNDNAFLGTGLCCGDTPFEGQWSGSMMSANGILVIEVLEDSPADNAGLEEGDLILVVDGDDLDLETDLAALIQSYEPGDEVVFEILRDRERLEVTVKLGSGPDDEEMAYLGIRYQRASGMGLPYLGDMPGFHFQIPKDMDGNRFRGFQFGTDEFPFFSEDGLFIGKGVNGIVVVSVAEGSPAEEACLQEKDVITALDGEPVKSISAFTDDIADHKPGDIVVLTVFRPGDDDGETLDIEVYLGENPDVDGAGYLGVSIGGLMRTHMFGDDCEGGDCFGPFDFQSPGNKLDEPDLGNEL